MIRRLATLLLPALVAFGALSAQAVGLRDHTVIDRDHVVLGDLFTGLGDRAAAEIGAAPPPGEQVVFGVRQLARLAERFSVDWEPYGRAFPRVVVQRDSRPLDALAVGLLIGAALAEREPDADFDVEVEDRHLTVHLPLDARAEPRIESLTVDRNRTRVQAVLVAPGGRGSEQRVAVAGRLHSVVDIPVLREAVMPGTEIRPDQIAWARARAGQLRQAVVTDAAALAGMTPRRPIAPGAPIPARDLQPQVVVARGAIVTIVYEAHNMILTARGRALEDAAIDRAVRVLNVQSNTTIEARVVAPGRVHVSPPRQN